MNSENSVMGDAVNRPLTATLGWLVAGLVTALNIPLIFFALTTHPG